MAGCALEAQIAIQRQKPDRERFWGNADIAFAENDPIFRSGWFERLKLDEGLPQVFRHSDFTAASLALGCAIDETDGVGDGALGVRDHRPADVADLFGPQPGPDAQQNDDAVPDRVATGRQSGE